MYKHIERVLKGFFSPLPHGCAETFRGSIGIETQRTSWSAFCPTVMWYLVITHANTQKSPQTAAWGFNRTVVVNGPENGLKPAARTHPHTHTHQEEFPSKFPVHRSSE